MAYWLYCRINVHVGVDDEQLMRALDEWADTGLKAGRAGVTNELRDAIRAEHADARELYGVVMRGA